MVGELELAGARRCFGGGAEIQPRVEGRGEIGAGQNVVARAARVVEAEFERTVAQPERADDRVQE